MEGLLSLLPAASFAFLAVAVGVMKLKRQLPWPQFLFWGGFFAAMTLFFGFVFLTNMAGS